MEIKIQKQFFRFSGISVTLSIRLLQALLILIFSTGVCSLYAQSSSDSVLAKKPEIRYIEKVDTIVSVKLNINTEFEQFMQKGIGYSYDIRPNIALGNKISFSYRFISLGIGFKPKFIPGNNDNDMQGKTRTLSFGVNIITSHWMQELQFGYVSGFYLHNTADFLPDWKEGTEPYLLLPDLKVAVLRGSTGYKFNKNYSLKAISSKTEIQLRSCGSFIPILRYDYFETDNKSSDTSLKSSQKSNNLDVALTLGYAHTFVIRSRFYASFGFLPGVGIHHTNLLSRFPEGNIKTKYNNPLFRLQENAAIGYNTRRFYAGAEISAAQSSHSESNTTLQTQTSRMYFQVFVGYRFTAPKFLRQKTNQVKNLAPTKIQQFLN